MEELLELNPDFNNPDGDEPMEIVVEEKRPNKKGDKQAQNAPAPTGTRPPSGRPQGSKALAATAGGDRKSGMENGESSGRVTMSEATRGALPGALREIFSKHHVCRYFLHPYHAFVCLSQMLFICADFLYVYYMSLLQMFPLKVTSFPLMLISVTSERSNNSQQAKPNNQFITGVNTAYLLTIVICSLLNRCRVQDIKQEVFKLL